MSGIAGILRHDERPLARDTLVQMGRAMAHRGPRAHGAVVTGQVGFAHRALHAYPEEEIDDQPLACAGVHIVADARLDNRDELARAFGLTPRELARVSDAALIARGYEQWGRGVVTHLTGDFAFALTDGRTLFCARDPIGARPFVYCARPGFFAFASEVRALFTLDEVPRTLDEGRVADYLVDARLEARDRTSTFFGHVHRLAAAHTLTVARGQVTLACYWDIAEHVRETPRRVSQHLIDDSLERFRDVFTEAVRARVRGPYAGAMLSGGVDSSAIVAVARASSDLAESGPLRTYSSTWATRAVDDKSPDRPFIDAVVAQGGLHATLLTPDDTERAIDDVRALLDETTDPYDSYLAALPLPLWLRARDDGVRTLTTGIDGDLVLSHGTAGMRFAFREGRFRFALEAARGLARLYGRATGDVLVDDGLFSTLRSDVVARAVPERLRAGLRSRAHAREAKGIAAQARLAPAFAHASGVEARLAHTLSQPWRPLQRAPGDASPNALHAARLTWPIVQAACERYDRVGARAGILPTHPLLDRRLLECVVALPWTETFRGGVPKSLLRRAVAPLLPAMVRDRPQSPAPHAPFVVRAVRALVPLLEERFDAPLARAGDVLPVLRLRASLARFRAGDDADAHMLWHTLVMLSFVDRFR